MITADDTPIKARFIGKDKSMGFRNGRVYAIKTWVDYRKRMFRKDKYFLMVYGAEGHGHTGHFCPYSNLEAMLNNWELLEY